MNGVNKTRVVFTGDISFSGHFYERWKDESCLAPEIKAFLRNADYAVGNVESPLSAKTVSSRRKFNHVSDPVAGKFLADMNIKIWSMANNHVMDCGADGVMDSLSVADQNDCCTIGIGRNADEAFRPIIVGDKVKVGMLSVADGAWKFIQTPEDSPGTALWSQADRLKAVIASLKEQVDWIVLVLHAGDEHCDIALPHMRKKYLSLLDLGADIIVAHHPHVVQQYEYVGNKLIFYSLGNFIFDTDHQRDFRHTENGILLGIDFEKTLFSFDVLATCVDRKAQAVIKGDLPAVFREFDKSEYQALWPLVSKIFYPVDLKRRKKTFPRLQTMNPIMFLAKEAVTCRYKKYRIIHWGRLCSLKGSWKKTCLKKVCDYLMEQA